MKKFNLVSIILTLVLINSTTMMGLATENEKLEGNGGIYSISNFLVINENANKQATLLIVKEGVSLSNLTKEDILYIDQALADGSGQVSFNNFRLMEAANADVYIGGEALSVPKNPYLINGAPVEIGEIEVPAITEDNLKVGFDAIVTVKNQTGENIQITTGGKYGVVFGEINNDYNGWELVEWGIDLLHLDDETLVEECKADAVIQLTENGKFGMMLYGPGLSEDAYKVRVYAKYKKFGSDNAPEKVIGNIMELSFV